METTCLFKSENLRGRDHSGGPRHRWDNVRIDLNEIGWEGVDWIHLAQDREQWRGLVNTVIRVP
jgi:hypothetical protein